MRAVILGVGVSTLALACSFGEIDDKSGIDQPSQTLTPGNDATNDVEQPDVQADAPKPVSNPGSTNSGTTPAPAYDPDADPFNSTELGKEVKAILETNCGRCHQGTKSGDMDYILNLRELVKNEKVIPGNSADSDLFVRMQQQSMPPAFERIQRPTFGQIDQVGQFIDELDPDFFGAAKPCNEKDFLSLDEQITAMANDISRLDENDKPFTRYLTINYSTNAGQCEIDYQRQRYALFKGINSVSTEATIGIPQPIDQDETIYRIDIRDYNWDRAIDLEDDGVVDFDDAWDAILAAPTTTAFAVPFTGDQADDLVADSGTAVPFMAVNAFIQASELDDTYYALIGAKANLFDFEEQVMLIDIDQALEDDDLLRAGFSNSGVSKQERVLNRFDQGTAGGYAYWISFDFDGGNGNGEVNVANESIYQDPIDFQFAGGEAIFNLPNGMQAYYVAAANGDRLNEAPVGVVIDPAQNNGVVTNGASCHSCHNAGMITFTDTVRQFVLENKQIFDNETFEHVLNQYPTQAEFQRAMDADSALHVNAVVKAGVPKGTPDAVSRVFLDFQLGNIDSKLAAGELHVTEKELLDNLDLLDPALTNLGVKGGYVDRDVFTDKYVDSLCILHSVDENQPANCP